MGQEKTKETKQTTDKTREGWRTKPDWRVSHRNQRGTEHKAGDMQGAEQTSGSGAGALQAAAQETLVGTADTRQRQADWGRNIKEWELAMEVQTTGCD